MKRKMNIYKIEIVKIVRYVWLFYTDKKKTNFLQITLS